MVELHAEQLGRYGGSEGVLQCDMLGVSVASPMVTFAGTYLNPDSPSMAAAYLFSLARNDAFADGNKRVAAAGTVVVLDTNGLEVTGLEDESAELTLGVAAGLMEKAPAAEVIRAHVQQ